ncbi:MAG: hypothetical protein AAF411_08575, partial [Myxococcota bacterium]
MRRVLNQLSLLRSEQSGPVDARFADAPKKPSLFRDESGAIMVMGVLMAAFLVGMLYYIVGLGDAIAFRERMQDTSDAGTYTAAVVGARGMNLIVLLNLVMAVIMSILIALKLLEVIITIALAIAFAANAACFGCATPAIAILNVIRNAIKTAIRTYEPIARNVINVLHEGQGVVRLAWPAVGQARAINAMVGDNSVSGSPSTVGGVVPIYATLPTEDHEFFETCVRGAPLGAGLVAAPFHVVPIVGGKIARFVKKNALRMFHNFAGFFCGGGATPDFEFDDEDIDSIKIPRPSTPASNACAMQCQGSSFGSCNRCEGSGSTTTRCAEAVQQACNVAVGENSVSGPVYCDPPDFAESPESEEEFCNGRETVWQSCFDTERGRRRDGGGTIIYTAEIRDNRPVRGAPVGQDDARARCLERTQDAAVECRSGPGRANFSWGTYTAYVVYFQNDAGNCEGSVVDPAEMTNGERGFSGLEKTGSPPPDCERNGFGTIVGPRTPFDSSCGYTPLHNNWRTTHPSTTHQSTGCAGFPRSAADARRLIGSGRTEVYESRRITELYGCTRNEDP